MLEQDGELLLVMDYVQGESLQALSARANAVGEQIPPAIAVAAVCGILQGLEAVHAAKSETGEPLQIVHRDVSPENIRIGRDGIGRLLDFGIARGAGRKHITRMAKSRASPATWHPSKSVPAPPPAPSGSNPNKKKHRVPQAYSAARKPSVIDYGF